MKLSRYSALAIITVMFNPLSVGCQEKPLVYKTIHEAADKGDLDDVKRHLKKGTDVNGVRDVERYEMLVMVGDNPPPPTPADKVLVPRTPLHVAAENGNEEMAKLLLEKGADVRFWIKDVGTPLHLAASKGKMAVAKLLVKNGADVNAGVDRRESPPLRRSIRQGNIAMVEFLVDNGADVNAVGNDNLSVTDVAAVFGDKTIFEFLRQHGGKLKSFEIRE